MKKILALTLVFVLCLGVFVGCQPKEVWEQTVFSFGENQTAYKYYGRVGQSEKGVEVAWPASGVEFALKCSGDVKMNYTAVTDAIMHISVDGAEPVRPKIKQGNKSVTLAEGLPEGEHTIRVLFDNDINGGGASILFKDLEFYGVKTSVKATPNKDVFIEFVGDSITSGYAVLDSRDYQAPFDTVHSATHSYAYLTAQLVDADWSLVSRGAIGLYRSVNGKLAPDLYRSYNCYDPEMPEYDFARPADIVVLALGTNDASCPKSQEVRQRMADMVALVREKNGEDVQIVIIWGMMSLNWAADMRICAIDLGCHSIQLSKNNLGGGRHPNAAGMALNAKELAKFLTEKVIPLVEKQ